MNRIRTISLGKGILFFLLCTFLVLKSHSQCGHDIYIANDQSGSVDSRENTQSRQFIEQLALAFPLGNANTQSRIAVSSWGWNNEFQQYNFPSAGVGYTTSLSDIINYRNSVKPFNGGTDPYVALVKAYQNINLTPVAGRNVPKLIILMTDAYSYQVNSNIVSLANQIKAAGYRILVMGVEAAAANPPQPILQAVASPGLNFTASSYDALIANAVSTVQQAIAQVCPATTPPFDLTIAINSFDCDAGSVNYIVNNTGGQSFGPAVLSVSFYSGNPKTNTARLLATHSQAGITIASNSSGAYAFSDPMLSGTKNLYAVVNLSVSGTNAVPPLPDNLSALLKVAGEANANNNFSSGFNSTGCSKAVIQVNNTGLMGCNNTANYQVQVCNTGSADANIQNLAPLPSPGFILQSSTSEITPAGTSLINSATSRLWATYFGGTGLDKINDLALDAAGNIYVTGTTNTSLGIATSGTFDNSFNGGEDGFAAKFSPAGVLLWGTYFGGSGDDFSYSIAVDGSANVYVAGYTSSSTGIAFGGHDNSLAGATDAFLIKFSGSNGSRLWGTYYGESSSDAIDGGSLVTVSGTNVYLAMLSDASSGGNNLSTNDSRANDSQDIVLVKFNSAGNRQWGTFWGGPSAEYLIENGDLVADANSVFVGGYRSTGGITQGFLIRFNPTNGTVNWATNISGTGPLMVTALCCESTGSVLVGTSGVVPRLLRYNATGGPSVASINCPDIATSITTDAYGNIYTCGATVTTGLSTAGAYQPVKSGNSDIYFSKYSNTFTLLNRSYYGDVLEEGLENTSLGVDGAGNIIIAGNTTSPGTALANPGAYQTAYGGGVRDGIIAKFEPKPVSGILPPGSCVLLNYIYNAGNVIAGTYSTSFDVSAIKVLPTDNNPVILPNTNFTVSGYTGTYNGFNGAANTTDDVVKVNAPCVTAASPVTIAITFGGAANCGESFRKATVTITNPNTGISFSNARLLLNLTGTGSVFSGEPYNIAGGLLLPSPDITNPNYPIPGVAGQLSGFSGQQYLTLYSIPPGTSSFDIDIALGTGAVNLSAVIQDLPVYYNPSGNSNTATGAGFSSIGGKPVITLSCPGSINAGSTILMSATTTGATTVQWGSATAGDLNNSGSVAAPQTTYTPTAMDLVNGYADISLTAVSSGGCDDVRVCRVLINNVQRDFGDAPTSFDLGTTAQPVAAASTKLPGLYLGSVDPDVELVAQPTVACNGDGDDEEGLGNYPGVIKSESGFRFEVQVTNNSSTQGYLVAYIDWNEDGDFLDANEQSLKIDTIVALTGTVTYRPSFTIPGALGPITTYMRLRLSSSADAVTLPYGASPEGEVEDHVVSFTVLSVDLINFKATASGKQVILTWETVTETNNDHFDIERSEKGSDWQKIGTANGYGNSSQLKPYGFTDYQPYDKSNYYRLKQVNSDGSFSYSPVRRINFESTAITRIYPNPVKDQLRITSDHKNINYDVTITNIAGQEMLRKNKVGNESIITVTHLPAGVYIVKLSDKDDQPKYYKIIKQ